MARYIDADEINPCEEDFETRQDFLKAIDMIVEAPTADVVEVIRCKDCCFYEHDKSCCQKWYDSMGNREIFYPDDFCCDGEKR